MASSPTPLETIRDTPHSGVRYLYLYLTPGTCGTPSASAADFSTSVTTKHIRSLTDYTKQHDSGHGTRHTHNGSYIQSLPPAPPGDTGPVHSLTPSQASETPAYIISALTSIGGVTGYVRTGSVPSIAAGLTVGALYGLGGYRISKRQPYGVELALLASVILAGSSIPRAIKTGKPLPAGLSVLAATGLFIYGKAFLGK
ncbi:hypothetical protein RBB50_002097 [Rhinocladiella similis]